MTCVTQLTALAGLGRPHPARPVPPETGTQSGGDHALFWSLSFAVHASVWRELGGFCEQYRGYGGEDPDFGQLAASHRIDLTWVGGPGPITSSTREPILPSSTSMT